MKHELKACPFCGGDDLYRFRDDGIRVSWVVCMGCDGSMSASSAAKLARRWNRRAGDERSEFAAALRGLMNRGLISQADVERIGKGQFSG